MVKGYALCRCQACVEREIIKKAKCKVVSFNLKTHEAQGEMSDCLFFSSNLMYLTIVEQQRLTT